MKYIESSCTLHAPHRIMSWGDPVRPCWPMRVHCPECISMGLIMPKGDVHPDLLALVDKMQRERPLQLLTVYDPVSARQLRGPAITGIQVNSDYVQVSIHPEWWAETGSHLGPNSTKMVSLASLNLPRSSSTYLNLQDDLYAHFVAYRHRRRPVLVWDPVSRRLIPVDTLTHIRANDISTEILLPNDWVVR